MGGERVGVGGGEGGYMQRERVRGATRTETIALHNLARSCKFRLTLTHMAHANTPGARQRCPECGPEIGVAARELRPRPRRPARRSHPPAWGGGGVLLLLLADELAGGDGVDGALLNLLALQAQPLALLFGGGGSKGVSGPGLRVSGFESLRG